MKDGTFNERWTYQQARDIATVLNMCREITDRWGIPPAGTCTAQVGTFGLVEAVQALCDEFRRVCDDFPGGPSDVHALRPASEVVEDDAYDPSADLGDPNSIENQMAVIAYIVRKHKEKGT